MKYFELAMIIFKSFVSEDASFLAGYQNQHGLNFVSHKTYTYLHLINNCKSFTMTS